MSLDVTTLGYIKNNKNEYLMLFRNKKENDINQGKWVGVGGHLENNETIHQCMIREVKEETGLDVIDLTYRGELLFLSDGYEEVMHLFLINEFKGELIPCNEGELRWIKEEELLSLNMWEGDKIFLPLLINSNEFIKLKLEYKNSKLVNFSSY